MNRRPAGVVICAVVLGLTGAIQLLFAVLSGVAAVIAPKMPAPAQAASTPPPAGFLLAIMLFSTVFYLVLAGWAGATMVGLLRMRPWSRISMIVIGAGLILAGLFGALGMSAAQLAIGTMPLPPNADPRILHITFILLIILALLVVGLGVWWVVYFALGKMRNAFSLAEAQRANRPKWAILVWQRYLYLEALRRKAFILPTRTPQRVADPNTRALSHSLHSTHRQRGRCLPEDPFLLQSSPFFCSSGRCPLFSRCFHLCRSSCSESFSPAGRRTSPC